MVANVLSIDCEVGDTIGAGDTIVLPESMKMEIPVLAEHPGRVTAIRVAVGDVVREGDPLIALDLL
ncbi:biotin/lipoyl-binding carrier protein [Nocardioides sp. B-3]|nr:biotin/lipoyl-binding carrier protein [Nocardioides sp. B-3]